MVVQASSHDEWDRRWAKVDKKDADELLALAEWAQSKKMSNKARLCYRKVLRIEPQNTEAHEGLGHVKVGDEWLSPADAKKRAGEQVELPSRGVAEFVEAANGDILTLPDEENSRAAVESSVLENSNKSAALKEKFIDRVGVDEDEYSVASSEHTVILAKVSEEQMQQLVQIAEYAYRKLNWITFRKIDKNPFRAAGGKHYYFMVDTDTYDDLVYFIHEQFPHVVNKAAVREILKRMDVGGYSWPGTIPLHFQKGGAMASCVANGMGHHLLVYNCRSYGQELNIKTGRAENGPDGRGNLLSWWQEGLGIWMAYDAIGVNNYHRTNRTKYSNVGKADKGKDNDYVAISYEIATGQWAGEHKPRSFDQLTRTKLPKLNDVDLAMSWSIVDYMIRERTTQWRKLVTLGRKRSSFRVGFIETMGSKQQAKDLKKWLRSRNQREVETLYRKVCDEFEQGWKAWVSKAYKASYDDPSVSMFDPPYAPLQGSSKDEDKDDNDGKKKKKKKKKKRRRRRR